MGEGAGDGAALAPGGNYTLSQFLTVPSNTAIRNGYLLFVADINREQGETDDTNNVFAVPFTITAPDADLIVTSIAAPTLIQIKSPVSISWTVRNQGTVGAASYFYNYLYASRFPVLDGSSERYLGSPSLSSLAAGASDTVPSSSNSGAYVSASSCADSAPWPP